MNHERLSTPALRDVERKAQLARHFDKLAPERERWVARNRFFYDDEAAFMRFLVPKGKRVLELGCGTGRLLDTLQPSVGVGIDLSERMVEEARRRYPKHEFHVGDIEKPETFQALDGPFDYIVLVDAVGYLDDVQGTLRSIQHLCTPSTRLIVGYFSQGWRPLLSLASRAGLRMPTVDADLSWLSSDDIAGMLELAGFDIVRREWRMLIPRPLAGVGRVANAVAATLPGVRRMSLRNYVVARPQPLPFTSEPSVSIVVPCRNEEGNVPRAVERLPRFAEKQELIFVEGNSSDGTVEAIKRVMAEHPEQDIRFLQQTGRGKGDAVRLAFEQARGEVLIILDADLTVAPEDIPKFYEVMRDGRAEFVNGTRLVYPREDLAMRRLNTIANHAFARIFSWLLNQRLTDTLCGTKVIRKSDYEVLTANRSYFGEFDPFGDFDLLFGASRLSLKIVEIPVRYSEREYGEPQISRFRDGALLAKMVVFAWKKMKVIR